MYSERLVNLRIWQIVIMFTIAIFIYQYSYVVNSLWIPVAVLAIVGTYRSSIPINQVIPLTIAGICGLLLSIIITWIVHYSYGLILLFTVVLVYSSAFCVLWKHIYFILLVTILLSFSLNFDFSDVNFKYELVYFVECGISILIAVIFCQIYEYWLFQSSYKNVSYLVDRERLDQLVIDSWEQINYFAKHGEVISVMALNQCLTGLLYELDQLHELKVNCQHSYSQQAVTLKLIEHYELKLGGLVNWIAQVGYKLLTAENQKLIRLDIVTPYSASQLND